MLFPGRKRRRGARRNFRRRSLALKKHTTIQSTLQFTHTHTTMRSLDPCEAGVRAATLRPCFCSRCVRRRNGSSLGIARRDDVGAWSPCRGVRGGALPLENEGGQARQARSTKSKLHKNKIKLRRAVEHKSPCEPIAMNRRRESAAHLGVRASSKDAFVCAPKRVRAQKG